MQVYGLNKFGDLARGNGLKSFGDRDYPIILQPRRKSTVIFMGVCCQSQYSAIDLFPPFKYHHTVIMTSCTVVLKSGNDLILRSVTKSPWLF